MQLGKDITAVVTGGASGLGGATARGAGRQRRQGRHPRSQRGPRRNASPRRSAALLHTCDVTSEASVDAALAACRAALGQERILVNCAGIGIAKRITRKNRETGAIEPHDLATFTKVIQINLIGTFLMTAKCAAGMQGLTPVSADGERGVIISTASVAAEDGQIGQVAYAASKGGVLAMTLPIARDLAQSRHPRGDDHAGPVPHPDVRRLAGRGAGRTRGLGAVPLSARQSHRVCGACNPHLREQHAERRLDPP